MQTDINDNGFRDIRNAALITWFIMVGGQISANKMECVGFIIIQHLTFFSVLSLSQGILNPMQAFLNTLAFHGWTGFDVDFSLQRRRELAWDSVSTSVPNAGGHNPMVGSTLLYQSHVQETKKNMMGNGQHHSDGISVLSEGNWAFSGVNSSPVYQGWWGSVTWRLLMPCSMSDVFFFWVTPLQHPLGKAFVFLWLHQSQLQSSGDTEQEKKSLMIKYLHIAHKVTHFFW